jgi:hypothetical protein
MKSNNVAQDNENHNAALERRNYKKNDLKSRK